MHAQEGALRAMVRDMVEAEGVEVPRASWPQKPPETAAALLKMWKWKGKWWVDLADIGFFGPYSSLTKSLDKIDLEGMSAPIFDANDVDTSFEEEFTSLIYAKGKDVFSHIQSREGCGSSEWVTKWDGQYWSGSLDHGSFGPSATLEDALSDEARYVSDATSSITCSELSAADVVPLLFTYTSRIIRPFEINDIPYHVVDGKIVPYVESDEDS